MRDRVQLRMVNGRPGPTVLKEHYDLLSTFILEILESCKEIGLVELLEMSEQKLSHKFERELPLYLLNIKQDLEAKGLIHIRHKVSHKKNRVQIISLSDKNKKTKVVNSITGKPIVYL